MPATRRCRSCSPTRREERHEIFGKIDDARKRLLPRLSAEIKQNILQRNDLVYRRACRENDLPVLWGQKTNWKVEFERFIAYLKTAKLHSNPAQTLIEISDFHRSFEISGQPLKYRTFFNGGSRRHELNFIMYKPKVPLTGFRPLTRMLNYKVESRGTALTIFKIYLGNLHDVHAADMHMAQRTRVEIPDALLPKNVAFDDQDRVYYWIGTTVYRKSLISRKEAEQLFTVPATILGCIAVGKNKVFVYIEGRPAIIFCYDLETKQSYTKEEEESRDDWDMVAHANTCVIEGLNRSTIVITFKDNQIQRRVIHTMRRQRLNKDTYIIMINEGREKMALKTLSIIGDSLIEHFVQYCDEFCVFKRYTDQVFYVCEKNRRWIWLQQDPRDFPVLIHTDRTITKIVYDVNLTYSTERTLKRRNSIGEMDVEKRT